MKENIKISDMDLWQSFLAVAKYGNFSKAASACGFTISQLSKRISKLEDGLGTRLFNRSTRVVGLTEEAELLKPRIESILEDLKRLDDSCKAFVLKTMDLTCFTA